MATREVGRRFVVYELDCLTGAMDRSIVEIDGKRSAREALLDAERNRRTELSYRNYELVRGNKHRSVKQETFCVGANDVYKVIGEIGKLYPASLREVSIFSHATHEGPVLVNSYDYMPKGTTRRDNLDYDMRAGKDFVEEMWTGNLDWMRKAFAPDGIFWVWGCNARIVFRALFDAVLKTNETNIDRVVAINIDDTRFAGEKNETNKEAAELLRPLAGYINPNRHIRINATIRGVLAVLFREIQSSYAYQAASQLYVPVYAAPVGVQANLLPNRMCVGSVDKDTAYVQPIVDFYTRWFRFPLDSEGLQYIQYSAVMASPN